jgi:hypothetical protein
MRTLAFLATMAATGCNVSFDADADTAQDPADTSGDEIEVPVDAPDVPTDVHDPCDEFPGQTCVVLPHAAGSVHRSVPFHIDVGSADIYLLIDTTGSMTSSINDVLDAFSSHIVSTARSAFEDVRLGVGHFNDFPQDPYGDPLDMPYWNVMDLTDDVSDAHMAIESLLATGEWGYGRDGPESNTVALALTATGDDLVAGGADIPPRTCPFEGDFGYPCFRHGAIAAVLMVSDAPWHNGPADANPYAFETYKYDFAVEAFVERGMSFMGLFVDNTGDMEGRDAMNSFANDVSCVDAEALPFVSEGSSTTAGERSADLIQTLRDQSRFDVGAHPEDVPGDPPDGEIDAAAFVVSVMPESSSPLPGFPSPTMDGAAFHDAYQGTDLVFTVELRNSSHPAPAVAQVDIVALAEDRIEIGRERIVVIVP